MGPLGKRFAALSLLAPSVAPPLLGATTLDELKVSFNQDAGVLRLVVLVSPTCPACVRGAGWIQEYALKRNPTLDVKVYAIWHEMYPGDRSGMTSRPRCSPPAARFSRTGAT